MKNMESEVGWRGEFISVHDVLLAVAAWEVVNRGSAVALAALCRRRGFILAAGDVSKVIAQVSILAAATSRLNIRKSLTSPYPSRGRRMWCRFSTRCS